MDNHVNNEMDSALLEMLDSLATRLEQAGQGQIIAHFRDLSERELWDFAGQLEDLDLDLLQRLYAERDHQAALPTPDRIAPIPLTTPQPDDRAAGEEALRRGEVAVLVVAGGQGTRLGFDHPKGMFLIGPVSGKSLFQVHAEKVLALTRRYGKTIPLLVMTSPTTHDETLAFFAQNKHFGLSPSNIVFFRQGTMPALDLATGRLLLESKGHLALSPNGHGGTLLALAQDNLLGALEQFGVRHVFYFQVDNPLVVVADPVFLGHHLRARAEVSTKAILKHGPQEKLGNLVLIDGRCGMIEYSDLPADLARQTEPDGRLRFRVGNPAIHIFDLEFLKKVTTGDMQIAYHVARKKVPYLDEAGQRVEPATENALKFEMFIFDVLPRAERWTVMETDRRTEFHPVKNATGNDSPATVRQAMANVAGAWLEAAGVSVPRDAKGDVAVTLEISPLLALDAGELPGKVGPQTRIAGPTYLG
jgi:UDP-N-acetylglucosamine/UDP-N-acetylgalactosamine diphosphorylase